MNHMPWVRLKAWELAMALICCAIFVAKMRCKNVENGSAAKDLKKWRKRVCIHLTDSDRCPWYLYIYRYLYLYLYIYIWRLMILAFHGFHGLRWSGDTPEPSVWDLGVVDHLDHRPKQPKGPKWNPMCCTMEPLQNGFGRCLVESPDVAIGYFRVA